jgi:hypothetical protein
LPVSNKPQSAATETGEGKSGMANLKVENPADTSSATALIDHMIQDLHDWRGDVLKNVRTLIRTACPDVRETWKWRGIPVWEHKGIICTGETYKAVVKLTFAKGASLPDPTGLFNASLEGNVRRAIDIREGAALDETAFITLIRSAVELNGSRIKDKQGIAKPTIRA